jgi:hypothetical protein
MAAQQASKAMANLRTVLVKVSPAPATLSERRAILRILKQRGEVDLYKKLQVGFPGPSTFLSGNSNDPNPRTPRTSSLWLRPRRWPVA